jgi:hypothetical protein
MQFDPLFPNDFREVTLEADPETVESAKAEAPGPLPESIASASSAIFFRC